MKLLLRRDQRSGLMGKPIFVLEVRAELTADEKANIKKYRLHDTELYSSHDYMAAGNAFKGMPGGDMLVLASQIARKVISLTISVKDLEGGKKIEAKDVVELLSIEDQIRIAAQTFKQVLDAAAHFGGEEVLVL